MEECSRGDHIPRLGPLVLEEEEGFEVGPREEEEGFEDVPRALQSQGGRVG